MSKSIAIIGGGPAGATLATLLHRKGWKVGIFHDSKPRELFVGESLIPAMLPIVQELGVEGKIKNIGVYKPGATVWVNDKLFATANFGDGKGTLPPHAYNVNRKELDAILLETARKEGATIFSAKAKLKNEGDKILLAPETIDACDDFFDGQPDFVVDASGRRRVISNFLELEEVKGKRKDVALFAHVKEKQFEEHYGDIHMHLADKGWCWEIPLKDKTSIGVVVRKNELQKYGNSTEEQFDNYLQTTPKLKRFFKNHERISKVQKYSNYQLQSKRIYGENWALVGDAAGFLDPVFSSGMYLAMQYAAELAKSLDENRGLKSYQKMWNKELKSWKKMIEIWYNGRLFTNFLAGNDQLDTALGKRIGKHAIKHFTAVFTGEAVRSNYSMNLLRFMTGPLLDFMYFTRMHRYKKKDLEL